MGQNRLALALWGSSTPDGSGMADPQYPLNCPRCPHRLAYVASEPGPEGSGAEIHIYACQTHGLYRLTPDGRLRAESVPKSRSDN